MQRQVLQQKDAPTNISNLHIKRDSPPMVVHPERDFVHTTHLARWLAAASKLEKTRIYPRIMVLDLPSGL
jgi:hypothetical protein